MEYFLIAIIAFLSGFSAIFFRPFSKLIVGIANALTPGQRFKTNIFKPDDTDSNDNDSTRPFLTITKSSKPTESKSVFSESVNRLRHLAGLK